MPAKEEITRAKNEETARPVKKEKEEAARSLKKKAAEPAAKPENRVVRYFKEVRAELQKVTWPSRRAAANLTGIVLGVTVAMSIALGAIDWVFARLIALLVQAI